MPDVSSIHNGLHRPMLECDTPKNSTLKEDTAISCWNVVVSGWFSVSVMDSCSAVNGIELDSEEHPVTGGAKSAAVDDPDEAV